jgi:hypothetical protein
MDVVEGCKSPGGDGGRSVAENVVVYVVMCASPLFCILRSIRVVLLLLIDRQVIGKAAQFE